MKLKDIVRLLANRINQPHVIEVYLRKIYAKGFKEGTKQSPWISIEMAIPKEYSPGVVQVRTVDGKESEMAARKVMYNIYPYVKIGYVTHWRVFTE